MKSPDINAILRANPRNSAYGAPMGDSGFAHSDNPPNGILCQRVRMVDGDYSPDGTYWGCSPKHGQMYAVFNGANSEYKPACGLLKYYRAHSRAGAIAQFLADYPECKLSRGAK